MQGLTLPFLTLLLLSGCRGKQGETVVVESAETGISTLTDSISAAYRAAGMVNIANILPEVVIDLKYSTEENFLGEDMYGDFDSAFVQPDVAVMLQKAWKTLQEVAPELTFILFDAVRPLAVQKKMWAALDMPVAERGKYVSNPEKGSVHNYGAALDITLADKKTGVPLDMGTPYDFFGPEAQPELEAQFFAQGKLTRAQWENRKLLRRVMESAGFRQLPTEWWHYNACSREEAEKRYKIIQ